MILLRFKILFSLNLLLSLLFATSCSNKTGHGPIIISRTTSSLNNPDFYSGESWRYYPNSSIVALNQEKKGKEPMLLTGDFVSACSPDISYDGKNILFAGRLKQGDHWQIWEMNLANRKYKKVTQTEDDCLDPVYLPGERAVFTRRMHNDTTGTMYLLFTCDLDGSDTKQITFHPHADFAPAIMADGRILMSTRQIYPEKGNSYLMVLRPDGTKADRFFPGPDGGEIMNRSFESKDGKILFIESKHGNSVRGDIFSLNISRPLGSKKNLTSEINGSFYSLCMTSAGRLLVAFRPGESDKYGLYEFDLENNSPGQLVYSDLEFNVTGAVVAEPYQRPKKLPSEVDMTIETGQIMCQNTDILGPETAKNVIPGTNTRRIEVLGINSSLGIVSAEEDGSFYLKPHADMPFRIQTIDETGRVINGPSGWIWLRPNERRGCVGCHEDPELVPDNRLSMAVKKLPVLIPVHVDSVREKSVELE